MWMNDYEWRGWMIMNDVVEWMILNDTGMM
jgi:hypothetical protein